MGQKLVHGISGRRLAGDDLVCWIHEADKASSAELFRHGFKCQMQRETFIDQTLGEKRGWLLIYRIIFDNGLFGLRRD